MIATLERTGPAYLFCPGSRPEMFLKATAAADIAVFDLEDGVAEADKDRARAAVVDHLRDGGAGMVRINLASTERGLADALAVTQAGARLLLVPKVQSAADLSRIAAVTDAALIATIEDSRGVIALQEIVGHADVIAISWGPYDLAADMGLRAVRDSNDRLLPPIEFARNQLLIHAAAAGKPALDTVTSELNREDVLAVGAAEAALLGFHGKFAIHPRQVPLIRAAFVPDERELERSRRLVAAAAGGGAILFEGEMVDNPMLRRAQAIIAAAEALRR